MSFSKDKKNKKRIEKSFHQTKSQLIYLWQIVVYSSISAVLGWLLIRNGWSPINIKQLTVIGTSNITTEKLVKASEISLPIPLFSIDPKQLEASLLKKLPISSVLIRRHLLPPGLEIEVKDKQPVAHAIRWRPEGIEKGMLDDQGQWMSLKVASLSAFPPIDLVVEGWMDSHREKIALVFEQRKQLGSPLQKIIFNPNGELSLLSKGLGLIHLGDSNDQLKKKLKTVADLNRAMPAIFRNKKGTVIDMSDPSKPEMQLPQSQN